MNLLSAVLVATAVGMAVVVVRRLGVPLPIAVAAAIGFALTPLVWRVGVAADAHALHAVLLVAIVGLLAPLGAVRRTTGTPSPTIRACAPVRTARSSSPRVPSASGSRTTR